MDWTQCVICQKATSEPLRCPLQTQRHGDKSIPYDSFLNRVMMFRKLNKLPASLDNLGEDITVNDFIVNEANWHKSCHAKFSQDKLERAKKRASSDTDVSDVKRICPQRQSLKKNLCIFCQEETGLLHEFSTLQADSNVRSMAVDLEDGALLARLEGGDLIAQEAKYHLTCLTKIRNHHRSLLRENQLLSSCIEEKKKKARALAELITYIENCVEDGTFFSSSFQSYVSFMRIV